MPCCTKNDGSDNCYTCGYSIDGDPTCYSPLIRTIPPQDAEWISRDGREIDEKGNIKFSDLTPTNNQVDDYEQTF